jgi:hypothetical protein
MSPGELIYLGMVVAGFVLYAVILLFAYVMTGLPTRAAVADRKPRRSKAARPKRTTEPMPFGPGPY